MDAGARRAQVMTDEFKAQGLANAVWAFARLHVREEVLIEWDDDQHGEGTAVMLKSDRRRGVTADRYDDGEICVRFEDNFELDVSNTDDVLAVEAGPWRCAPHCSRGKVGTRRGRSRGCRPRSGMTESSCWQLGAARAACEGRKKTRTRRREHLRRRPRRR